MKPSNKIRAEIFTLAARDGNVEDCNYFELDDESIEAIWKDIASPFGGELCDYYQELRESGEQSNLPSQSSWHYECYEVAHKLSNGDWVGWTYWYAGGKYGEPEAIEWIEDAYDLIITDIKTITVNVFKKVEN